MEHRIVSQDEWNKAHAAFLQKEKELTHLRDELARQRRELPWTPVTKNYVFDSPDGKKSLADLFAGKSQLIVQHFMLGPGWKEGCSGCSFQADHVDGALPHLTQKDVTFVAVSRAPLAEIESFKARMGWKFPWVSSYGSDFNYDYHVTASKDEPEIYYNFRMEKNSGEGELHGLSVFYKDEDGRVYHSYSSYARGCEMLMGTYMYLDLLPKGREEEGYKESPMEWVKLRDQYQSKGSESRCH